MITVTLAQIKACSPHPDDYEKLARTYEPDTPVPFRGIVDAIGLDFALQVLSVIPGIEREKRLLACAFARRVVHLGVYPQGQQCIDTARRFADGQATEEELTKAQDIVWMAANAMVRAMGGVARFTSPAWAALDVAGACAAPDATWAVQYTASAAVRAASLVWSGEAGKHAAWAAEREWQAQRFIEWAESGGR